MGLHEKAETDVQKRLVAAGATIAKPGRRLRCLHGLPPAACRLPAVSGN